MTRITKNEIKKKKNTLNVYFKPFNRDRAPLVLTRSYVNQVVWTLRSQCIIGQYANCAHFVQDSVESTSLHRLFCMSTKFRYLISTLFVTTESPFLSLSLLRTAPDNWNHKRLPSPQSDTVILASNSPILGTNFVSLGS